MWIEAAVVCSLAKTERFPLVILPHELYRTSLGENVHL